MPESDQPRKKIVEQLEAYSRKRRQQANQPFQVPALTRKRMHQELARQYDTDAGSVPLLARFVRLRWWRLGLSAVGVLGALVLSLTFVWNERNRSKSQEFAAQRQLPAAAAPTLADKVPNPVSDQPEAKIAESESISRARTETMAAAAHSSSSPENPPSEIRPLDLYSAPAQGVRREISPQSQASAPIAENKSKSQQQQTASGELLKRKTLTANESRARSSSQVTRSEKLGVQGAGGGAGPPVSSPYVYSNLAASNLARQQGFTRIDNNYRRNYNSPPLPKVLDQFQAQQVGQNLIIVDSDGSTYEGVVRDGAPSSLGMTQSPGRKEAADAARFSRDQSAASQVQNSLAQDHGNALAFTVSGTNLTLNQKVVFEGNYLAGSESVATAVLSNQASPNRFGLGLNNQISNLGRIEGRATVGGTNRLQIEAVPIPAPNQ